MHPIISISKLTNETVEIEELDIIIRNPNYVDTETGVNITKTKLGFVPKTIVEYEHNCLREEDVKDVLIPDGVYLVTAYKSDAVIGTLYVEDGKGEIIPY